MTTHFTRRNFLTTTTAAAAAGLMSVPNIFGDETQRRFSIGICDWDLRLSGNPKAFALAKELGYDGVEVSYQPEGEWSLSQSKNRPLFLEEAAKQNVKISSLAMGLLNARPLSFTPEAAEWVADCIETLAEMKIKTVLLAFFGNDKIKGNAEARNAVIEKLKVLAPKAEKNGVVLGFESWLNAKEHLAVLEAVGSPALKVYYDEQNMLTMNYPIYEDLETLLKEKAVCRIHVKENSFRLGDGLVDFKRIRDILVKYGYKDWVVAESGVKGDWKESLAANAEFLKQTFTL
ncbi:MAG: sugar phosphate isomerase/epimerase [Planctomycetaceae bacterium]|jgi:sugar phosphate isomerase/epimerase|nr:sugar phosphate isomerase/epimerase [Planctomycetaceae bacterium]